MEVRNTTIINNSKIIYVRNCSKLEISNLVFEENFFDDTIDSIFTFKIIEKFEQNNMTIKKITPLKKDNNNKTAIFMAASGTISGEI